MNEGVQGLGIQQTARSEGNLKNWSKNKVKGCRDTLICFPLNFI